MKRIPSDKVIVTYRGQTVEFSVDSLHWEQIGGIGDPTVTLRGTGPRFVKLKVQLPSTEDALALWGTGDVDDV